MAAAGKSDVLIAGAGIAGLTAALAFAARGFPVQLLERSPNLREIGAGLQLSPNATRILERLGVLAHLRGVAVRPPAVLLRDASTLRDLARVPLGEAAERRWGAPYLVVRRADLQQALLAAAQATAGIEIATDATVTAYSIDADGVAAQVETAGTAVRRHGHLLVAADGVWSRLRETTASADAAFTGQIAWRRTVPATQQALHDLAPDLCVTAHLSPGFHLIAYPVRSGSEINIVAFTKGDRLAQRWSVDADVAMLRRQLGRTAPPLAALADDAGGWTAFPVFTVPGTRPWTNGGCVVLIGDAAHAMTPYAAQGAAMAIEDGQTLADAVAGGQDDLAAALSAWEASRRLRIDAVRRRGAFNRFAWHARGPVAAARNLALRMRPPETLAADLDWLYGWGR